LPALDVIRAAVGIEAAEQTVEVLGVAEILAQNGRGVRVSDHVVVEPAIVLEDVPDDATKERDVGTRAQRNVQVGEGAGAGEAPG